MMYLWVADGSLGKLAMAHRVGRSSETCINTTLSLFGG